MVYIHVQHTVEDYAKWKEGFDTHAAARQAAGATDEAYVMRNVDNPNEITVILGWSDLEKAKAFTQSASLKEAMQKAGVTGPPEVRFLEAAG
jgi:heme-degrading monooxygenase HmoA